MSLIFSLRQGLMSVFRAEGIACMLTSVRVCVSAWVCVAAGSPQPHRKSWPGTGHRHAHRSILHQRKSAVPICLCYALLIMQHNILCLSQWESIIGDLSQSALFIPLLMSNVYECDELCLSWKNIKTAFANCTWGKNQSPRPILCFPQALMFWVVDNFLMKKHRTKAKLEEREEDSRGNSKVRYRRALSHEDSESEVRPQRLYCWRHPDQCQPTRCPF